MKICVALGPGWEELIEVADDALDTLSPMTRMLVGLDPIPETGMPEQYGAFLVEEVVMATPAEPRTTPMRTTRGVPRDESAVHVMPTKMPKPPPKEK
jgi:hypothetical protein